MKKTVVLILILVSVVINAQGLGNIADIFKNGKQEEAMAKINSILKIEPKNAEALVIRSRFYAALNKLDKMIKDLDTLNELHPENISVYLQRAAVYKYQKKYNRAIAEYRKVTKIEPKDNNDVKYVF